MDGEFVNSRHTKESGGIILKNVFKKVDHGLAGGEIYEKESIKRFLIEALKKETKQVYYFIMLNREEEIQSVYKKTGEPSTSELFRLAILEEAAKVVLGCNSPGTFRVIDIYSDEMSVAEEMDTTGIIINIPVENHFIINDSYTFAFQDFDLAGTAN